MVVLLTITVALALHLSCHAVMAQDVYEPCPQLPDRSWASEETIMADSRWVEAIEQVDRMLANATQAHKLPGLVATVTVGQRRAWFKGYGKRDARDPTSRPPAEDDLVWIASIKTFTSCSSIRCATTGSFRSTRLLLAFPGGFGYKSPFP